MIAPWLTVLTTPARPEYLTDTLYSLARASGGGLFRGHRIIFVDGDPKQISAPNGWTKLPIGDGRPRGPRRALWKILHLAAAAAVPYVLYFEDDVCACRNAAIAMAAIAVPAGCAFLTFLNQTAGLPSAPPAIYCRRGWEPPGLWGCQALKIPARSLRMFGQAETEPPIDGYAFASDTWLGDHLGTFGIVMPALVRHVGERTTIPEQQERGEGLAGHRAGLNYAGDEFDARELLAANLPVIGM